MMRPFPRAIVVAFSVVFFTAFAARSAVPAETLLYDVTTVDFAATTAPALAASGPVRVEIVDNGPATPEISPRWQSNSPMFAVWDRAPVDLSAPDSIVFGHHCAQIQFVMAANDVLARVVQDQNGVGSFAWIEGARPDGSLDPYAFFCLKGGHQSTTAWSEWVRIGKRVYGATPPPPTTVKVFITQPRGGETVGGTVWVVLWAEGTGGASNTFTLSADGQQVRTETTSSRGPVTIPWPTAQGVVPNGTHTLTGTVRDAAGNAGTATINVIVGN